MEASASKTSPGPSQLEMFLMGMGACASSNVISILENMHQDIDDVTVEVEANGPIASLASSKKNPSYVQCHWQGISLTKTEEAF